MSDPLGGPRKQTQEWLASLSQFHKGDSHSNVFQFSVIGILLIFSISANTGYKEYDGFK